MFSTHSHRTHFFWAGLVVKPSFFFFFLLFSSHILNPIFQRARSPSIFSFTLDLSDLLPSPSPSISDLTIGLELSICPSLISPSPSICCRHPWSRTLGLSIFDLTIAIHLLPSLLVSNSRLTLHLRSEAISSPI